ncbi:MAG TPA: hypothetical protein DCZ93_04575 [Elusimicrobia bacterium]|nr:hypothetical protein [Elusimicrobiota bacterium]
MKLKIKSLNYLIASLFLLVPVWASALHTDPTVIEVGDIGHISIPFENREGGISPIENVRLVVTEAPAWVDIDAAASFMGPASIYPGELMTFSADYKINSSYNPESPAGGIILNLLSDSTSFVPSGVTWTFATENGFKTMRGTCVANDGVGCGTYLSADTLAPNTYLQFDGPSYESDANKIFLSTNTLVYFIGSDSYESNAEISRVALTGYSVAASPASFDALNFSTIPVLLGAGQNALYFASRDNVGNTEVIKSSVVYVDAFAPTVDFEVVGESSAGPNGIVVIGTSSAISFTGIDSGAGDSVSGLNSVMCSIDVAYSSNTAVFYAESFTLAQGTHTVYYTAFDNVGNQSEVKSVSFIVGAATQEVASIGNWQLDEGSGSVAHDSSGNGNDANISGAMWTDGISGKALSFNGAGDDVDVPNVAPFQGMAKLTVELWAYTDNVDLYSVLLHKNQAFVKGDYLLDIGHGTGDGRINFRVVNSAGQVSLAAADDLLAAGSWVYVVGTYDGAEVALYINGVKQAHTEALTGSISNSGVPLRIGGAAGYSKFWNGKIDNVAIYDDALTQAEIQAHYYTVTHSTPALKITSVSPGSGIPGGTVTVIGISFGGNAGGLSRVLFGSTAAVVSTWSDTAIEATIPETMRPGAYAVKVERVDVATTTISNALNFVVLSTVPSPAAAEWHFDETGGNVASDASANGNNGTLFGPVWAAGGKVGGALNFDGSDYLEVQDSPSLNVAEAVTVAAWVKYRSINYANSGARIFAKGTSYSFFVGGPNNWNSNLGVYMDGVTGDFVRSNTALTPNEWYHVAYTYDGANIKFYLNGQEDGVRAFSGGLTPYNGRGFVGFDPMAVGGYQAPIDGYIDELAVYDRALSAQEIKARYDGLPVSTPAIKIGGISPSSAVPGATVTVNGVSFGGNADGNSRVLFGESSASVVTWTDTAIEALVPGTLAAGAYPVTVKRVEPDSTTVSNAVNFVVLSTVPSPAAAEWHFDETSGDVAYDASANANNGTLHGPVWSTDGKVSGALDFDGSDYLEIPDSASLSPTKAVTVAAWVKYRTIDYFNSGSRIFSKGVAYSFTIGGPNNHNSNLAAYIDGATGGDYVRANTPLSPNVWQHVAFTYDGAMLRFYLNGQPDGTVSVSGDIQKTPYPGFIGWDPNAVGGYHAPLDGNIDELAVYDRALSAEEIKGRYDAATVSSTTSSSEDGLASITTPGVEIAVVAVSTETITSTMTVYTAMTEAGLEPMLGAFYEFEPSGVQFETPATLRFSFDPVGVDTNTLAIYYFDGLAWSSAAVFNQRVVFKTPLLAYMEGEILHTSLYGLLRTSAKGGPQVSVKLSPEVLNLDSRGGYITAELTFMAGSGCFKPETVNIGAINGTALAAPIYAHKPGNKKKGGYEMQCGTATMKFDRDAVAAVLPVNAMSDVIISGVLSDGTAFTAEDTIKTIKHFRGERGNKWHFVHRCGAFLEGKAGALREDLDLFMLKVEGDLVWREKSRERSAQGKGVKRHGGLYEFGPGGLKFDAPVTISLPYDAGYKNPERLAVAYWNEASSAWEPLVSRVDKSGHYIKAEVAHFSQYQVVEATFTVSAPETAAAFRVREDDGSVMATASTQEFRLGEVYVYPDPAKGGKVPTFHIEVGTADSVKIRVYTVAGQLAHERTLAGNPQAVGGAYAYEYAWEGRIASGVYYYTIEAERSGKKIRAKGKFSVVR